MIVNPPWLSATALIRLHAGTPGPRPVDLRPDLTSVNSHTKEPPFPQALSSTQAISRVVPCDSATGCLRLPVPSGSTTSHEIVASLTWPTWIFVPVSQAASQISPAPCTNDMLLMGQVEARHGPMDKSLNESPLSPEMSNVASRSVPPVAARYNTPNRPLPSRNAFKPQQPHAPLPFGLTCRSAVKVFPSSVERATRTTRYA